MGNLVIRWRALSVGIASDLSKFYPSLKLRTEDWNLQFLWMVPSLKVGDEPEMYVVTSLIFGMASVAAQSEAAMAKIAERYPDLKEVLESRYVDDLATSVSKVGQAEDIRNRTTEVLTAYQLIPKGKITQLYQLPSTHVLPIRSCITVSHQSSCGPLQLTYQKGKLSEG